NVIAPIRTEPGGPAWRQSIFHPFALTAKYARGQVLRVEPECATIPTDRYGEVPAIWATATHDEETGELALFVVNRDRHRPCELELTLPEGLRPVEHIELADDDPSAVNTAEAPDRVVPRPGAGARMEGHHASVTLTPASWSVVRFTGVPDRE
ncbi:alpha-L-arabinofuranosidase C-terminal domain-containing protein, partial [Streptosporangium sp. NPDC050855]|uniref:alpha-L-arabinofuranosidase C-terminal domain-containing protein n=1 Tax=Streptosporangium sp. NPDC050855 TaxID=3366194 RepID=UPI0037B27FC4